MAGDIIVPNLGESVTEAIVATWFKKPGDAVAQDEPLVELETDKVTMEVGAPAAGALKEIKAAEGDTVEVGGLLGVVEVGAAGAAAPASPAPAPAPAAKAETAAVAVAASGAQSGPAARKILDEKGLSASDVAGSGKDGRVTKGDALAASAGSVENRPAAPSGERAVERVKMSKLRQTIARRLKESQDTAAILTTFNEIDMSNMMQMRNEYKDAFLKKHGVKLGFMGMFVKAACQALQAIPSVNASIEGNEIIYRHYCDVGVAVGTPNGLVVPIVRNADKMGIAEIEAEIGRLAGKARDGALSMEELTGGTFTISNGGVYGSLMSTPIINPPQSGILGMHKIEKRPVVVNDEIVIRPMMYVALSYDHRIIDGSESVTFLVKLKEAIEDPRRLVLGV